MLRTKSMLAAGMCAIALAGAGANVAYAGEVTGPPGAPGDITTVGGATGAPEHSNSICSFNGLNDMNQGPDVNRTQTPHNQGDPGDAGHGNCAGGTNFARGIPR